MPKDHTRENNLARSMVESASPEQRDALLSWAIELQSIRRSSLNAVTKAQRAVKATTQKAVLAPLVKANLKQTKEMLWGNRGWPARLALVGVTVGTLGFSGKVAGLAAFGRAIGVPIWFVLAASGALLGALIQELQQGLGLSAPTTTYTIIEAHEERRSYLEEREAYYRSLPEEQLDKVWKQREELDLQPDETALLREIVRETKGIKPAYGHSAQVCGQCGMVGSNCTCERSWF